jgi:predicted nucleotide-binding protein
LHERPDGGKTIIEKFENNISNIGFAIILLTNDDEGKARIETDLKARARQNVIFEMGYFIGKLGRDKVFLLLEQGVEKPGDLDGIVYTLIDSHEGWKLKLVKELKSAGYQVSADNL